VGVVELLPELPDAGEVVEGVVVEEPVSALADEAIE
jgi:hypothetical protein